MRPALRIVMPPRPPVDAAEEQPAGECDPASGEFRVTDRLRRWGRAAYFADAASALRYAEAGGGIVWERYLGPTGAPNWWSLTEHECDTRLAALDEGPDSPAAAGSCSAHSASGGAAETV